MRSSRMLLALCLLLCLLLAFPLAAQPAPERRVALVIGNSAYKHTPALPNPRNDATAMAGVLKRLGFEVEVQADLTKADLDAALRRFGDRLEGAQVAVFFYAGHGMQVNGLNYIIPIDARLTKERDLSFETVEMTTILKQMEAVKRTNLVFLDACRDNPLARNLARSMGPGRSGSIGRGLAPIDASTGTLISYATRDGSYADDGSGRNSPYTAALLAQIEQPGLEVGLMLRRVREKVMRDTGERQVPWEYGSLLGEFYFAGPAAAQTAVAPAQTAVAPAQTAVAPAPAPAAPTAASEKKDKNLFEVFSGLFGKKKEEPAPAPAASPPPPAAPAAASPEPAPPAVAEGKAQPSVDIEAEKRRLAVETEGLRRDRQHLEQLKALRVEQERIDQERQRLDAAKKLAMAPGSRQRPGAAQAASRTFEHSQYFGLLARDGLGEAKSYFEKATEARPEDAEARAGLALAYLLSKREADAKYQVRRIEESGAQTAYTRTAKGLMLGLEGLHSDSTYQLNRALEQGADKALVQLSMAAAAEKKGELDQARRAMEEYKALVPEREQGEFARELSQKVDIVGRLAGTFYWTMPSKSISALTSRVSFARSGNALTGTGTGLSGGTIENVQVAGKALSFRWTYNMGLLGSGSYDFTGDLGGDLDTIPVKARHSRSGRVIDGYLIRQGSLAQNMAYKKSAAAGCFIATAAYGDPGDGHVATLRRFRDRVLLHFDLGRRFVDAYYQTSPPIAEAIRERPWACALVRGALAPVVVLAGAALGEPADLAAVALAAATLAVAVAAVRRRRARGCPGGPAPSPSVPKNATSKPRPAAAKSPKRSPMRTPLVCTIALVLLLSAAASLAAEKRVALLIGNSKYATSPLKNPTNDATDMANLLKRLGFDVTYKLNADMKTMVQAVNEFGEKLRNAEVGLFYFAGHGMQIKGRNFLIPVDARLSTETDIEYEAVDAGRVLGKMESAGNKLNIVILDACRDNPFARSFRSVQKGLAQMDAPTGSIIAYATAPGSVAADGTGRNGVYTENLLRNLSQPGVNVEKVFKNVRIGVLDATKKQQTPWESSSLTGEFYFAEPLPAPAQAAAPAAPAPAPAAPVLAAKTPTVAVPPPAPVKAPTVAVPPPAPVKAPDKARAQETTTLAMAPIPKEPPRGEKTWTDPATGMNFVWVEGGCFDMGCGDWTGDCGQDEKPVHKVCVKGFWLAEREVTQRQWQKVMGGPPKVQLPPDFPAAGVSFDNAGEFIDALSGMDNKRFTFRLPSEAEWEYACRSGGKLESFSGGNNPAKAGWHAGNSDYKAHATASKAANALGLYDMSGNVSEWVLDFYEPAAYEKHKKNDPKIETYGSHHVLRGGSYNFPAGNSRCSARYRGAATYRGQDVGFRLLREP